MKIFKVNKKIQVVCEWKKTRNGFKHTAVLFVSNMEMDNAKCCYLNRTWERYEFESVLKELANKTDALSDKEKKAFLKFIKNQGAVESKKVDAMFKNISSAMSVGEIFGQTKKEKNDWKERMLKAGLENKGLIMPENWNELDESEKERRLNGTIKMFGKEAIK